LDKTVKYTMSVRKFIPFFDMASALRMCTDQAVVFVELPK